MTQPNKQQTLLLAIPIIAAIALIPFVTGEVFAQDASDKTADRIKLSATQTTDARISVANTDSAREPSIADSPERRAEIVFKGATKGWAIFGGQAYPSGIQMFDGYGIHVKNGIWKVSTVGEISVGDGSAGEISSGERVAKLELKGTAAHGKLRLHGTGTLLESGEQFRIILRGHFAPVHGGDGDFVVAFSMAAIKNMETGARIPLIQQGIVHVEPADSTTDDYEKFLETFDVAQ